MPVLLLGGTTASGKSSLAIELAKAFDAVIVSADAMTIYRGLSVGTAKPGPKELAAVTHYGIDIRDPHEDFDVSNFVGLVGEVTAAHPRVIVVGGTTFWLSALVRPLAALPPSDPEVRSSFEGIDDVHGLLASVDPDAAERIHPNDRVRIVRALEVHTLTGKTQTELHRLGPRRGPIDATVVWIDREDVYERINRRTSQMMSAGYIDEVSALLNAGVPETVKPFRSFAYRHIVEHLVGDLSIEEAERRTARDTRHYAKKQRTWARNLNWQPTDLDSIKTIGKQIFEAI